MVAEGVVPIALEDKFVFDKELHSSAYTTCIFESVATNEIARVDLFDAFFFGDGFKEHLLVVGE